MRVLILGSPHSPGPITYARTDSDLLASGIIETSLLPHNTEQRVLPRGCSWPIGPGPARKGRGRRETRRVGVPPRDGPAPLIRIILASGDELGVKIGPWGNAVLTFFTRKLGIY